MQEQPNAIALHAVILTNTPTFDASSSSFARLSSRSVHFTSNAANTLSQPSTKKTTTPALGKPTERGSLGHDFHLDAIKMGQGDIM
ncbi:hypothetical protein Aduo_005536 [Ancylostoma duodenale]